ncbi:MAG: hypothetical protein U5N26_02180 [Candidatus Marinimicrobia bacterium]|nr:hypothetical protein [Candidatus Neomarinimicrobiota bacterium]
MKKLVFLLFAGMCLAGDLCVMFWNVENFFDIRDEPWKHDGDFMPGGILHYTYRACRLKTEHLAEVINHAGPHILCMAEVENRTVLEGLRDRLYHQGEWEIFIDEGPDIRGIDPALMYRKSCAEYVSHGYYPVFIAERGYHSRPIMRADLALKESGDTLSVFINHWPSRRGGKRATDPYRMHAAKVLLEAVKALRREHPGYTVLITGDLNDARNDSSVQHLCAEPGIRYLENSLSRKVQGTYCHNGEWIHFDHLLIAHPERPVLFVTQAYVVAPFWTREKETHAPLPFYRGVNFAGGYSDHYPVCVKLEAKRKSVE